ncbi:DUF6799 domain-containing protein [Flavitalea flava]
MKKIQIFIVSLLLSAGIFAQDNKMDTMSHKMKDCVMMKDGKMMEMKAGKTMVMDHDMTMTNGTMVMKDGTCKMKNGKTMMLKEGDCMYMNGKTKKMKMKKME